MVRVEVLFVAMPQEKALLLLPDLRDESKTEAAYTQVMAAIQRKEARLIGYPTVYGPSGQKIVTETIFEKIYPTQFQPTNLAPTPGNNATADHADSNYMDAIPTAFEKRNVGLTVEAEPVVRPDGKLIDLNIQMQHVEFDGMDAYDFLKVPGITAKVEQPRFFTNKEAFSLLIRNHQRLLVGVHQSLKAAEIELHILQVSAAPAL